jgi:tetratricopeptide (TPR) repeat protein
VRRGRWRLAVALVWSLAWLTCGCERAEPPSAGGGLAAGVASEHLSPLVRELIDWQQTALAADGGAGSEPAGAARLALYYRLRQDLLIPARRAAAADTLWRHWRRAPRDVLLIDLVLLRGRQLAETGRLDSMLSAVVAAAPDTSDPVSAFVTTRARWRRDAAARARFLAVDTSLAGDMVSASTLWLEARRALVEHLGGQADRALARLARTLPEAWRVGGPRLAACWWFDVSKISRGRGHLADALVAARTAVACADQVGDGVQPIRARLALGRAHLARAEYATAAEVAAAAEDLAARGSHLRWLRDARHLLTTIAQDRGDRRASLAMHRRSLRLARAMADTQGAVAFSLGIARAHRSLGRLDSCGVWIDRAEDLVTASGDERLEARILANRLSLLLLRGEFARADSLRRASTVALPPAGERQVLFELIEQALETGRADLAYRGLDAARREPAFLVRDHNYDPALDLALLAARFHARQGEFRRAARELETAAERVTAGGDVAARCRLLEARGLVAELADDHETATASYEDWLALARGLEDPDQIHRSRIRLGESLLAGGRFAEASQLAGRHDGAPGYWTRFAADLFAGCAAAGLGDHEAALAHHARAAGMLRPDAPLGLRARLHLERARSLLALRRPGEAWRALDRIVLAADGPEAGDRAEVHRAFHRPLRREIAEVRLELLADHPDAVPDAVPDAMPDTVTGGNAVLAGLAVAIDLNWRVDPGRAAPGVDELAAVAREAGGPVVVYFVGERRVFGWYTAAGEWRRFEIDDRAGLLALVTAVQTDMGAPGRTVDWQAASRLAGRLLDPVLPFWPDGRTLALMAPPPLDDLPWPALPLPLPPPGRADAPQGAAPTALVDHGALVHVADLARWTRRQARPRDCGRLLSVGVNGADAQQPLRLPEDEARSVAAAWCSDDVVVLTGEAATWPLLRVRARDAYRAVHLASHAAVTEGLPGQSTLWLTDAEGAVPVTIPEVRDLALTTDLVFLSSCEGSRPVLTNGTGLGSFARAFLQAGAGAVVASARRVDDAAAVALAAAFYARWPGETSVAAALRSAQLAVRKRGDAWRHPFFWAYHQLHAAAPAAGSTPVARRSG